jgi:hypothetical protein
MPRPALGVRWGLGDFAWVYVAGLGIGAVLGVIGIGLEGRHDEVGAIGTAFAAAGQFGGWIAMAGLVSRAKGRSLRADFGLRVSPSSGWALFAGLALFLVATALIVPLHALVDQSQQIVDELAKAGIAKLAVLAVVATVVAPVGEELLFRGLLLRSLRRRVSPVAAIGIQALVFALAHPLLSPTLGDFAVVPALFLLGAVSGVVAEQTGDLSASILMHAGFNLITTLLAF